MVGEFEPVLLLVDEGDEEVLGGDIAAQDVMDGAEQPLDVVGDIHRVGYLQQDGTDDLTLFALGDVRDGPGDASWPA